MEDRRIAWIKACVYDALDLSDDQLFGNMLARDEEKVKKELITLLDQPSEEYPPAIVFYSIHHEVEEWVEVVEGKKKLR